MTNRQISPQTNMVLGYHRCSVMFPLKENVWDRKIVFPQEIISDVKMQQIHNCVKKNYVYKPMLNL